MDQCASETLAPDDDKKGEGKDNKKKEKWYERESEVFFLFKKIKWTKYQEGDSFVIHKNLLSIC